MTALPATAQSMPIGERFFTVVIWGTCMRQWGHYPTMREAEDACLALRKFGFDAHVEAVKAAQ